jgi:hypothetical protein
MHQIMPYLNAVCNSYKDSKFCWYMIQMHQETREIDFKLVNTQIQDVLIVEDFRMSFLGGLML